MLSAPNKEEPVKSFDGPTAVPSPALPGMSHLPLVLRLHVGDASQIIKLNAFPATIGRSVFCDVVIEVDGVAARHASIERTPEGYVFRGVGGRSIAAAGVRGVEHLLVKNDTIGVGPVRIDVILSDDPAAGALVGGAAAQSVAAEWGPRRMLGTATAFIGAYALVAAEAALSQFYDFWPPERPSEIFTEALGRFGILVAITFFAAMVSKFNTRSFQYLKILWVATVGTVWFFAWIDGRDFVEYNLWYPALRAFVPAAVTVVGASAFLAWLLKTLFPAWRHARVALITVVLIVTGGTLTEVRSHFLFQESDRRDNAPAIGYAIVDPTKDAGTVADFVAGIHASAAVVDGYREGARRELKAAGELNSDRP